MPGKLIYMDYAATSPVDQEVVEAMLPYFHEHFGNPSSNYHVQGWLASDTVEKTRCAVAHFIGADPGEIFFTSGATESINWALKSFALLNKSAKQSIITQPTEHSAVLGTVAYLRSKKYPVTYLPVDKTGVLNINHLKSVLEKTDEPLVSVMSANNETGILQPIEKISALKKKKPFWFCCDATQSIGKYPIDVHRLQMDLMAFSGHKLGAPKGIGVLYVCRRLQECGFEPLIHGGFQQSGLRSGTLNVPAIAGLAKAIERIDFKNSKRINKLKLKLETALKRNFRAVIIGHNAERAPHISSVMIPGADSEKILMKISHKLAVSNGAACNTAKSEPSHVLRAMGYSANEIAGVFRFSLGVQSTESDVDGALQILREVLKK